MYSLIVYFSAIWEKLILQPLTTLQKNYVHNTTRIARKKTFDVSLITNIHFKLRIVFFPITEPVQYGIKFGIQLLENRNATSQLNNCNNNLHRLTL